LSLAGLIVSIVGGTNIKLDTLPIKIPVESKVGIVVFVVIWITLAVLLLALASKASRVMPGEKRLLLAVALCTPLILVRLIYALLAIYSDKAKFSLFDGSAPIYLGMAVIEEFLVVIICLGIGSTLQVIPRSTNAATGAAMSGHQHNNSAHPMKNSAEMDSTPGQGYAQDYPDATHNLNPRPAQAPRRVRRGGPIHQLIGLGMDQYNKNRRGDVEAQ
jgi:hypothetical protein